jgi:hypothetical protein
MARLKKIMKKMTKGSSNQVIGVGKTISEKLTAVKE